MSKIQLIYFTGLSVGLIASIFTKNYVFEHFTTIVVGVLIGLIGILVEHYFKEEV